MNRTQVTLQPSDLFISLQTIPVLQPDGSTRSRIGLGSEPTVAMDAVKSAGLIDPLLTAELSRDVRHLCVTRPVDLPHSEGG